MNIYPFQSISLETAKSLPISHVLVALGSNYQAESNLIFAYDELSKLGDGDFSTHLVNPDYKTTQNIKKPDYTNQCAIIKLSVVNDLFTIINIIKDIEAQSGRHKLMLNTKKNTIKLVTLDIDVLAVKTSTDTNTDTTKNITTTDTLDNNLYNNQTWKVIEKRYPFKSHEIAGIKELGLID